MGILTYDSGDPFELRRRQATFSPFTYIANVTGQPGISLPLAWNADDLPIGIHFLGRYGDEATLLRLSAQLGRGAAMGGQAAAGVGVATGRCTMGLKAQQNSIVLLSLASLRGRTENP